jgi:prevent-host-death family protein
MILDCVHINPYTFRMPLKRVSFTNARVELSALIDEVQSSGRPIAITRHGKPVAVLMNMEAIEQKLTADERRPWKLQGSGTWQGSEADLDSAIEIIRKRFRTSTGKRVQKLVRDLSE